MATVSVRFTGDGASGDRALEAFGDAIQQMAQSLLRMQQVSRQQCQETQRLHERRLQEVLREQEQRLQDDFRQHMQEVQRQQERRIQEALRGQEQRLQTAFRQQLQEALHQQQPKKQFKFLGKDKKKSGAVDDLLIVSGGAERDEQREVLESRMHNLEMSLERALQVVFPRVDALLAHLESPSQSQTPSVQVATATSSTPVSTSGGVSPETASTGSRPLSSVSSSRSPANSAISPTTASISQGASARDLEEAVKNGQTEDVRRILDAGADLGIRVNGGLTLLMLAAKEAHPSVVSLLLERNADVQATSWDGKTALHFAAYNDRSGRCVSLLVAAGADVNSRARAGRTPLHRAAGCDNELAVRVLLEAGASKTDRDHLNRAPLDWATTAFIRRLLQF